MEPSKSGGETPEQGQFVDRGFTIRVSVASLLVGLVLAGAVGGLLLVVFRPTAAESAESITFGNLLVPLTAVITAGIVFWAIFSLPVRIARRRGVILDPEFFPWTGAALVGIVSIAGFILAILAGVI